MILKDLQLSKNECLRVVAICSPEEVGTGYSAKVYVKKQDGTIIEVRVRAGAIMTVGIGATIENGRVRLLNKTDTRDLLTDDLVTRHGISWPDGPITVADLPQDVKEENPYIDWNQMSDEFCFYTEKNGVHYVLPCIEVFSTLYAVSTEFAVRFCRGEDIAMLCKDVGLTLGQRGLTCLLTGTVKLKRRVLQDWEYMHIERPVLGRNFRAAQETFQETRCLAPSLIGGLQFGGVPAGKNVVLITSIATNKDFKPQYEEITYILEGNPKPENRPNKPQNKNHPVSKKKKSGGGETTVAKSDSKVARLSRGETKTAETGRTPLMDRSRQVVKTMREKEMVEDQLRSINLPVGEGEIAPVLPEDAHNIHGAPSGSLQAVDVDCVKDIPDKGFREFKKMLMELPAEGCELVFARYYPAGSGYRGKLIRGCAVVEIQAFGRYYHIYETSRDEKPLQSTRIGLQFERSDTNDINPDTIDRLTEINGRWDSRYIGGDRILRHRDSRTPRQWAKLIVEKMKRMLYF